MKWRTLLGVAGLALLCFSREGSTTATVESATICSSDGFFNGAAGLTASSPNSWTACPLNGTPSAAPKEQSMDVIVGNNDFYNCSHYLTLPDASVQRSPVANVLGKGEHVGCDFVTVGDLVVASPNGPRVIRCQTTSGKAMAAATIQYGRNSGLCVASTYYLHQFQ